MMNATLEQAQLDQFVKNCVTKPGAQRGEAFVTFTDPHAATWCVYHFHGRPWDASGIPVIAMVLPAPGAPKPRLCLLLPLSAAPKSRQLAAAKLCKPPSFTLSAEAPEFVPGEFAKTASGTEAVTATFGSDASTEDGGEDGRSEGSSDEKEAAA